MDWDEYFITIAKDVAKKSHCLSIQRGCVLVRDNHIVSTGYNGPPVGYPHCDDIEHRKELYLSLDDPKIDYNLFVTTNTVCPKRTAGCKSGEGRGRELCSAVHAEINAILAAAVTGNSTKGTILYCSFSDTPCRECAKAIINSGIKQIVFNGRFTITPEKGIMGVDLLDKSQIKFAVYQAVQ